MFVYHLFDMYSFEIVLAFRLNSFQDNYWLLFCETYCLADNRSNLSIGSLYMLDECKYNFELILVFLRYKFPDCLRLLF